MKTLGRALRFMMPYWKLQIAALLCAIAVTATNFVWPAVMQVLVDRVVWPQSGRTDAQRLTVLYILAGVMITVAIAGAIFGLVRTYLFTSVGERAAADLRGDLFRRLHDLPTAFFDRSKIGGIMSVVQNDVEALQGLYASTFVDVITNILTAVIAIALMFWRSPYLAVIGLPVPILFAASLHVFGRPLRQGGRLVREETGALQEVLQESIAGAREVKTFVRADSERQRFMERVARLIRARVRQSMLGATNGSVASIISTCGMTLVMTLGTRLVIARQMTAGQVIMFISVLGMLFGPASTFVSLFAQVAGAVGAADRVFEFLDGEVEIDKPDASQPERVEGEIVFDDVTFRYDGESEDALSGIRLRIAPGDRVALVGPSGAGKTTLVSLIARLYDVCGGRILLDGVDIRSIRLRALREAIAFVPQEPFLFAATAAENIGFGREGATHEEIVAAATAANADSFVRALPNGYDTQIGERGARLSVGQKQRIAIARALLRDPRILILDEATSAQDSESERLVQDAMRVLQQGRTSLVIAHRLSTVQKADRIVVLESGRIAEQGIHADLLAQGGLYARLHALQLTSVQEPLEQAPALQQDA